MKKRPKKLPAPLRSIGTRAHDVRERAGLTQVELARRLGLHPSQIGRFENGLRRLELETLLELCKELGAPVGWIFGGEGEPPAVEFRETDRRRRPKDDN